MNLPKKKYAGLIATNKLAETPLQILDYEGMKQLADELEKRGEFSVTQGGRSIVVFDQSFIDAYIKFLRGK